MSAPFFGGGGGGGGEGGGGGGGIYCLFLEFEFSEKTQCIQSIQHNL